MSAPDPQLAPALALAQLITEYPARPLTTWSIVDGRLEGRVYGPEAGDRAAVEWWAGVLAAEPVERHMFEYAGRRMQVVEVAAVWRDVPLVVQVSVPAVLVPSLSSLVLGREQVAA
ncbi:hypothetical protein RVR_8242 [Actinacidiphila reveromycinica]|uniref:Uncharacterized protein n=1 Tax=Actinacidiphila reveromycinica TaxID=659352 RepID=A0A7U3UVG5_9ACTN|nr:hypothetical protein [Streptomyces sp. SN-593]BBB01011.1 hypothetical protein RVR_8242 [Streptomyces sp. SN-593]